MSTDELYIYQSLPVPDCTSFKTNKNGIKIPLPVVDHESGPKSYAAWIADPNKPHVDAWYKESGYEYLKTDCHRLTSAEQKDVAKAMLETIKSGKSITTLPNINKIQLIQMVLKYLQDNPKTLNIPSSCKHILSENGHIAFSHALFDFPPMAEINLANAWEVIEENTVDGYKKWFEQHEAPWINVEHIPRMTIYDRFFITTRFYYNPRFITLISLPNDIYDHMMTNMARAIYNYQQYTPTLEKLYSNLYENKTFKYNMEIFAFVECEPILKALVDKDIPKVLELSQAYNEDSFFDSKYTYIQILHPAIKYPDLTIDQWKHDKINILRYTDAQLIKFFGLLMHIDANLPYKYISQIEQNSWFLLDAPQHIFGGPEKGTDLIPFSESEIPYLAHGNFKNGFTFYDIEGLARHFQLEDGMTFTDPWDRKAFKNGDLTHMKNLVEGGIGHERVPENIRAMLVEELDKYVVCGSPNEILNIQKIKEHIEQHPDQHETIYNFLLNFFYLGMYLRRWKGGNHEYPIGEHQSGSGPSIGSPEEIAATLNITESTIQTKDAMNKVDKGIQKLIWSLPLYQKSYGEERTTFGNLYACMSEVERGEYCIRFASGIFSYTAARYMYMIFKTQPPRFNFQRDEITIH